MSININRREIYEVARRTCNAIARALDTVIKGARDARRMHRAYEELSALSDVELQDIGMSRSDIRAAVTGTFLPAAPASNVLSIDRRTRPHPPGHVTQQRGRRSKPMSENQAKIVDVRSLMPAQRHSKIFQLVDELGPGSSFVLVNDHDPKPLYYQLEAEYPKQFSWTYLERGPEAWRVEIGKLAEAA